MSTPSLLNIPYLYKAGTLYSQIPESGAGDFTVSRTTTVANRSTRINKDGFIETVLDNVPRLDYPVGGAVNGCPALLVEPAATNGIRNNSMVGAVTGSPGTAPTNWSFGTGAGVSGTVTAVGTENGIPYIDLRISGAATATSVQLNIETANQIAALNGQVWTISSYLKTIASPFPPLSSALLITERTSGGLTSAQNTLAISLTSSLARYPYSVTLNGGPTTAFAQPRLSFSFTIGQSYDFTIRVGYPQMELGSVATSVIPTTTAAVTRSAETISKTGVSSLIGQTEGSIYVEVNIQKLLGTTQRAFIDIGQTNNRLFLGYGNGITNQIRFLLQTTAGGIVDFQSSATTTGIIRIAVGYKNNDSAMYVNGVSVSPISNGSFTATLTSLTQLSIGSSFNVGETHFLNDRIRAFELHPNRLTNAQLATLTAP